MKNPCPCCSQVQELLVALQSTLDFLAKTGHGLGKQDVARMGHAAMTVFFQEVETIFDSSAPGGGSVPPRWTFGEPCKFVLDDCDAASDYMKLDDVRDFLQEFREVGRPERLTRDQTVQFLTDYFYSCVDLRPSQKFEVPADFAAKWMGEGESD